MSFRGILQLVTYLIAALLGLLAGSFSSVVLSRLGREGGILAGRSHCPRCRAPLRWFELLPLVSFVLQGGRCRRCRGRISFLYPALEIAAAVLAVALAWAYGPAYTLGDAVVFAVALGLFLLLLFDIREFLLPDVVLACTGVVWLGWALATNPGLVVQRIPVAFALAGVFVILYVVSRGEWVGFGDVKLLLLVGFLFGYPAAVAVTVAAVWVAALVGISLVLVRGAKLATPLPFGAFLAAASLAALIFHAPLGILERLFS